MEVREYPRTLWPAGLLEIPGPPEKLWIRGAMPDKDARRLAVVGSRALSRYGKEACEMLIAGLAGYPISIISGLALGADACAHRAALVAGLHTIAVPGSGLDDSVIGPRANLGLAHDILESGGALLSENEPLSAAHKGSFPSRNRIMVGLSHAVLMIEAGENSGTLITARLATEYNRDLLAIPHRIGDAHGHGPHRFIRLGAALVTEPAHVLEALGIAPRDSGNAAGFAPKLAGTEILVWDALAEPLARDEIVRTVGGNPGETMTALVALELAGLVKEEFGAWRRT
ncbi:MAG TPA: DNA-processing protein DprA [Candidatus Paceibacterota bacterium]|nr:DNA-processing protein DprA [Candidatus Paceibacterota bacterium]